MALPRAKWPVRAHNARARLRGERVVVTKPDQSYELSDVADLIWRSLTGRRTVDEIAAVVADRYGVEPDAVRADVDEFMAELVVEGFVEWLDNPASEDDAAHAEVDWTNRPRTQAHFDPTTYDDFIRGDVPHYDELQAALATATRSVRASSILDLGTGTGETARIVLSVHPEASLTAFDASAEMLAAAARRLAGARVECRVGRLQDGLPSGRFDLVVSALALHRLSDRDKAKVLLEVADRLAPSGRVVIGDVIRAPNQSAATVLLYPGHDHPSSPDDLVRWLDEAGLLGRVAWQKDDVAVVIGERVDS
jgi:tRNA (cmo5U34)-methyltransferase